LAPTAPRKILSSALANSRTDGNIASTQPVWQIGNPKIALHAPLNDEHNMTASRITPIDALRGWVMFSMIFVNDLAGAGKIVPDWMVHFSDRHKGGSGMTFVDLVFPAFLFIVGMSIPFALGSRMQKGEPPWKIFSGSATRKPLTERKRLNTHAIGILTRIGQHDAAWTRACRSL
jgi:hypothetical protein